MSPELINSKNGKVGGRAPEGATGASGVAPEHRPAHSSFAPAPAALPAARCLLGLSQLPAHPAHSP